MDKMISYTNLYSAGSSHITAIDIDKGNDGHGAIIAPMTLVNLIEALLDQLKNTRVDLVEGVVLSERNRCILQLTISGDGITVLKDPIIDILDANYQSQHGITIDTSQSTKEIQISIRL